MISRLRTRISHQLSHPSGRGGRLVAALMNRGNRRLNRRAIDLLAVEQGSHVLDLGFGGGLALEMLLERGVRVTGVDRARDMVDRATERHGEEIASSRLAVSEGDVTALPLADDSVDGVLTVNTVYFWPELSIALGEIRRVLRPGGTLVIGIRDGSVMKNVDRQVFTLRSPDEIKVGLLGSDFNDVRIDSPSDQEVHLIVAR